MKFIT